MKFRNGFVSNSSSSSFVVLLPKDLLPPQDLLTYFNQLVLQGELWKEEVDREGYEHLLDFLKDRGYVVATLDGGPDTGQIVIADIEKVRAIINEH